MAFTYPYLKLIEGLPSLSIDWDAFQSTFVHPALMARNRKYKNPPFPLRAVVPAPAKITVPADELLMVGVPQLFSMEPTESTPKYSR